MRRYLGATNTYTVYDEAGHWLGDYNNAGAPIQQVVWLDDLPVGVIADKLYTIEPDHLGTPRAVIDPARNVAVWRWDLNGEAFGATAPNQDPDLDGTNFVFNLRYPGQRYNGATGLNYNYFRDYDASTGRYVESDPIGLLGDISTYGYAEQTPLLLFDRNGLQAACGGDPHRNCPYKGRYQPCCQQYYADKSSFGNWARYQICKRPIDNSCSKAPSICCNADFQACANGLSFAEVSGDQEMSKKYLTCMTNYGKCMVGGK